MFLVCSKEESTSPAIVGKDCEGRQTSSGPKQHEGVAIP